MKTFTLREYCSYLISTVVGFAVMAANANNTILKVKLSFIKKKQMRLFHPINSLVVTRNLWLILLSKKKDSKYVLIFSLASVVAELFCEG
jgi:hypothetical protein